MVCSGEDKVLPVGTCSEEMKSCQCEVLCEFNKLSSCPLAARKNATGTKYICQVGKRAARGLHDPAQRAGACIGHDLHLFFLLQVGLVLSCRYTR